MMFQDWLIGEPNQSKISPDNDRIGPVNDERRQISYVIPLSNIHALFIIVDKVSSSVDTVLVHVNSFGNDPGVEIIEKDRFVLVGPEGDRGTGRDTREKSCRCWHSQLG